ncbi:GNAT family N-acetyltransferase [Marinobacter caseinilyticus]|uniref:GNAT family N-acetyltransferase n=1 Tax=Marinobacter caseinilyticus TaxID=2692195 RepID=UPI001F30FD5B|nr:GNAT family N-acetyltransferase [Marinobacter caseinilyticus]
MGNRETGVLSIRKYQPGEESALRQLFFDTVRRVNRKHYTQAQVSAWAPESYDPADWCERIRACDPFVAVRDGEIVGFANLQSDGYIDVFYCHANYQGQGIGRALMETLLKTARERGLEHCHSHVSHTALPFFEHFGFQSAGVRSFTINGCVLSNHVMIKSV